MGSRDLGKTAVTGELIGVQVVNTRVGVVYPHGRERTLADSGAEPATIDRW